MFIVAFTTESGYVLGLGAITADGKRWIRWFSPAYINARNLPRVKEYGTRKQARTHAKYVLARAKRLGVLSHDSKSKVVEVWK